MWTRGPLEDAPLPSDSADEWDAGISPGYLREVVAYWRDRFDWRAQERSLNRFRQFRVEVDGTRLHLIHEPNRAACAKPLLPWWAST